MIVAEIEVLLGVIGQNGIDAQVHRPFHPLLRLQPYVRCFIWGGGVRDTLTVQARTLLLLSWARLMKFLPRAPVREGRNMLNDFT